MLDCLVEGRRRPCSCGVLWEVETKFGFRISGSVENSGVSDSAQGCCPTSLRLISSHLSARWLSGLTCQARDRAAKLGRRICVGLPDKGRCACGVSRFHPIARASSRWGSDACPHEPRLLKDHLGEPTNRFATWRYVRSLCNLGKIHAQVWSGQHSCVLLVELVEPTLACS